jgi:hypothetical protein
MGREVNVDLLLEVIAIMEEFRESVEGAGAIANLDSYC